MTNRLFCAILRGLNDEERRFNSRSWKEEGHGAPERAGRTAAGQGVLPVPEGRPRGAGRELHLVHVPVRPDVCSGGGGRAAPPTARRLNTADPAQRIGAGGVPVLYHHEWVIFLLTKESKRR